MGAEIQRQAYLKQSGRKVQNIAESIAQWLREQAVLAENPGSIPSPHMEAHNPL